MQKKKTKTNKKRAVLTGLSTGITYNKLLDLHFKISGLAAESFGCGFLVLHCQLTVDFVVTLEVVLEIRNVTLRCCDDAKASLADYYSLCIIARFKPEMFHPVECPPFSCTSIS